MKLIDDRQTTKQWLEENMKKSHIKIYKKQLDLMVKIWDYLVEHDEFDYTRSDFRKIFGYHYDQYSIWAALFKLQMLGYVKTYRETTGQETYQVTSWRKRI